jgi:hypothetical protein
MAGKRGTYLFFYFIKLYMENKTRRKIKNDLYCGRRQIDGPVDAFAGVILPCFPIFKLAETASLKFYNSIVININVVQ